PGERHPESDAVLGASDDAGATWHYTRISHIQQDGRAGDPYPLMDAQGTCYASAVPLGALASLCGGPTGSPAAATDATIVRLGPPGGPPPGVVATLARQFASVVAVFPTSQRNRLQLTVASMSLPAACGPIGFSLPSLLVTTIPS